MIEVIIEILMMQRNFVVRMMMLMVNYQGNSRTTNVK